MINPTFSTMKIYEVNQYTIENDHHTVTGIFTELPLSKSVNPLKDTDLLIIVEMSLHDGQFIPTGSTFAKRVEIDVNNHAVWSDWLEVNNKLY